ncbi:uncharacterized protein MYCFIDRAFT_102265, partial [Pseudocercospora fijiensis CIRAD86]
MPSVTVHPPALQRENGNGNGNGVESALPPTLRTPAGLALVELQGSILSESAQAEFGRALQLGRLVFPAADDSVDGRGDWDGTRVLLYIGTHQRMAGEVKKLSKPVAVIRRRPISPHASHPAAEDEVEIAEIMHLKMLFAHRPEPM